MAEVYKRADELAASPYKPELLIIVSDPSIPDSPSKESLVITAEQLITAVHEWNCVQNVTEISGIKPRDFLTVVGLTAPAVIGQKIVKNGDLFLVVSLQPVTLFLIPGNIQRSSNIVNVSNSNSPYSASVNEDIFIDVTEGPVTINLPTIHAINDCVNLIPAAGRYEVNKLTIRSTEGMHGTTEDVEVSTDGLLIQARWVGGSNGFVFISK